MLTKMLEPKKDVVAGGRFTFYTVHLLLVPCKMYDT